MLAYPQDFLNSTDLIHLITHIKYISVVSSRAVYMWKTGNVSHIRVDPLLEPGIWRSFEALSAYALWIKWSLN